MGCNVMLIYDLFNCFQCLYSSTMYFKCRNRHIYIYLLVSDKATFKKHILRHCSIVKIYNHKSKFRTLWTQRQKSSNATEREREREKKTGLKSERGPKPSYLRWEQELCLQDGVRVAQMIMYGISYHLRHMCDMLKFLVPRAFIIKNLRLSDVHSRYTQCLTNITKTKYSRKLKKRFPVLKVPYTIKTKYSRKLDTIQSTKCSLYHKNKVLAKIKETIDSIKGFLHTK